MWNLLHSNHVSQSQQRFVQGSLAYEWIKVLGVGHSRNWPKIAVLFCSVGVWYWVWIVIETRTTKTWDLSSKSSDDTFLICKVMIKLSIVWAANTRCVLVSNLYVNFPSPISWTGFHFSYNTKVNGKSDKAVDVCQHTESRSHKSTQ